MSYQGRIAEEELCEVAKGGKPENGSWLIPAHRQNDYTRLPRALRRTRRTPRAARLKRYRRGEFVYRLSGRERETSASYYTPESLTNVTVELALKHRLDQERDENGETIKTRAAELLSGRSANPPWVRARSSTRPSTRSPRSTCAAARTNSVNPSRRRRSPRSRRSRPTSRCTTSTAWTSTTPASSSPRCRCGSTPCTRHAAPWFGLHLRRGNSLIGARRAVYDGRRTRRAGRAWRTQGSAAAHPVPSLGESLPDGAVHQFLLPNLGWGAVARDSKAASSSTLEPLKDWRKGCLARRPPSGAQSPGQARAARRVEFLWSLVIKRMEISEQAISRRIEVWGADPADPEFAFLRQPRARRCRRNRC